jgi:hypothetical protein
MASQCPQQGECGINMQNKTKKNTKKKQAKKKDADAICIARQNSSVTGPSWLGSSPPAMKSAVLVVLFVAVVHADFSPPSFVINLDAPAESRWKEAAKYMVETHGFANSYGKVFGYLNG